MTVDNKSSSSITTVTGQKSGDTLSFPHSKDNAQQDCVRKISVQSPLNSDDVIAHIFNTHDQRKEKKLGNKNTGSCPIAIIDNSISQNLPIFEDIRQKGSAIEFVLCLKNKDFYKMDFVGILQDQLRKISCSSSAIERIVSASQEAYSNAFFWSSLDLIPIRGIRPYRFYDQVEEKLNDPIFGERILIAYLAKTEEAYEVGFHVQGVPIQWPNPEGIAQFRGTAIIASQTDDIEIAPDGKTIRLYFKN